MINSFVTYIQNSPLLPFLLLFLANNVVLCVFWSRNKKYKAAELDRLEVEAKAEGRVYTQEELNEDIQPQTVFTWALCICICFDIWLLGAACTHCWAGQYFQEVTEGDSNRALFGDSFGAVNALISAFAFAGMLVAFFLQRYELRLQRKELKLTRDEMNGQTAQFKKQNDTLQRERFETTFFHMLELQQQIVNELSTNQTEEIRKDMWDGGISLSRDFPVDEKISGRNLFYHAFCNIIHELLIGRSIAVEKLRGMREVLETRGMSYYETMTTPTYFDHYFRHLYTILQFIDKEDKKEGDNRIFSEEELYGYAKIVRATLSRYELVWLYYNGLSYYGNEKLKPLLEKYCMLKNLREDLLCCSKENIDVLVNAGKTVQDAEKLGFTGTDYEFFLTNEYGEKGKYHISAFYNTFQSQAEARTKINEWKSFINGN